MLYVTDGGVKDCTALVQLLRRGCRRVLLVLAAADPRDELGVLMTAMDCATAEHICSFYDPEDPRKSVDDVFWRYKQDKSMPYLHIGICYKWAEDADDPAPRVGHLFVVKNRLPPAYAGQQVEPLLTEEEIFGAGTNGASVNGGAACAEAEEWSGLTTDMLGSLGCCDRCHHSCNCGPKFPHGTFAGYLYLTPQWLNSLARLGCSVSESAVEAVSSATPLGESWETYIRNNGNTLTGLRSFPMGFHSFSHMEGD